MMNNEEVKEIIEIEGLGYAVCDYLSHRNIQDHKLAELWEEAERALNRIKSYLEVD